MTFQELAEECRRAIVDGTWAGRQCQLHNDCAAADAQARAVAAGWMGGGYHSAAHLPYPARWTAGWTPSPGEFLEKGAGM